MIEVAFDGQKKRVEVGGLTQWDYGRKLRVHGLNPQADEMFEFQFAPEGSCGAFRCAGSVDESGSIESDIPSKFLELGVNIITYIYRTDPEKGMTIYTVYLIVKKRPKPEDYDAPADKNIIRQIQEELNRKADGMQVTDGGLQLMSGNDPIGSPVELPSASVDIMPIPDTEIDEIMKGEETDGKVS